MIDHVHFQQKLYLANRYAPSNGYYSILKHDQKVHRHFQPEKMKKKIKKMEKNKKKLQKEYFNSKTWKKVECDLKLIKALREVF